jgi:hypothetical protein
VSYPVSVAVETRRDNRDRLTTALRLILAIPHIILVGPGSVGLAGTRFYRTDSAGLLGAAAYVLAIVNWFMILISGESLKGIRDFQLYYLRWRTRAIAYMALLVDPYPPFGDAPYPASIEVIEPAGARDRATVAVRLLLAVPHIVLLFFLVFGWFVATVVAWFSILFTGSYPPSLHPFGISVMRWLLRVEAYVLLLVDEYPPFALE